MASELDLRRQVCFALHGAARAMTAVYRPILARLGLTYPQYLVMLVLWERDHRTVKELGTELLLDSGTLSPLLKRLETAGYVTKLRSTEDERVVEVALTRAGRALRGRADAIPAVITRSTGLGRAELTQLHQTLIRLTDALHAASDSPHRGVSKGSP